MDQLDSELWSYEPLWSAPDMESMNVLMVTCCTNCCQMSIHDMKGWKYWKVPWDLQRLLSGRWKSSRLGLVFQKVRFASKDDESSMWVTLSLLVNTSPTLPGTIWNDPKHQIMIHSCTLFVSFMILIHIDDLCSAFVLPTPAPCLVGIMLPLPQGARPGRLRHGNAMASTLNSLVPRSAKISHMFFLAHDRMINIQPLCFVRCFHVHHLCEERWFHLITSDWLKRCFFRYRVMLGVIS